MYRTICRDCKNERDGKGSELSFLKRNVNLGVRYLRRMSVEGTSGRCLKETLLKFRSWLSGGVFQGENEERKNKERYRRNLDSALSPCKLTRHNDRYGSHPVFSWRSSATWQRLRRNTGKVVTGIALDTLKKATDQTVRNSCHQLYKEPLHIQVHLNNLQACYYQLPLGG